VHECHAFSLPLPLLEISYLQELYVHGDQIVRISAYWVTVTLGYFLKTAEVGSPNYWAAYFYNKSYALILTEH
jgi:hypothetical protein